MNEASKSLLQIIEDRMYERAKEHVARCTLQLMGKPSGFFCRECHPHGDLRSEDERATIYMENERQQLVYKLFELVDCRFATDDDIRSIREEMTGMFR